MRLILLFFLCSTTISIAQPNYEAYNSLLGKYVSENGKVNYQDLKSNAGELERITQAFSAQTPSLDWSRNERLAFWINAYNAFTLKLIVDNYPVSSITKLDNGKPWDVKRIKIGGVLYSLNQIENEIIRPKFKDPRIHFALNCAAKSCPPLYNKAYLPAIIDKQLDQQTRTFIRGVENEIKGSNVRISKIFDWYQADFGDLIAFLNRYSTVTVKQGAAINFSDYNWALNE